MARDVSNDFKSLKNFIRDYNLEALLKNDDFLKVLSQQHKKYFGYLTFIAEMSELYTANHLEPNLSKSQLDYLLESCSDIGNSIFVMTHGSYKAARMLLRSSIENFIKGFCQDSIPDITKNKNLFEIFNDVKGLKYFSKNPQKELLNSIHTYYSELCKDVHTATDQQMQSITALKYFPSFEIKKAESTSSLTINLVSNYLYLLCEKYSQHYYEMHYKNRENILTVIPQNMRPDLLGIEASNS